MDDCVRLVEPDALISCGWFPESREGDWGHSLFVHYLDCSNCTLFTIWTCPVIAWIPHAPQGDEGLTFSFLLDTEVLELLDQLSKTFSQEIHIEYLWDRNIEACP